MKERSEHHARHWRSEAVAITVTRVADGSSCSPIVFMYTSSCRALGVSFAIVMCAGHSFAMVRTARSFLQDCMPDKQGTNVCCDCEHSMPRQMVRPAYKRSAANSDLHDFAHIEHN